MYTSEVKLMDRLIYNVGTYQIKTEGPKHGNYKIL